MASSTPLTDKQAPIVIVGAGIFGLSSAIHLAQRGFANVTVFDRQPYWQTQYDFDSGCDAASAGMYCTGCIAVKRMGGYCCF